MTGQRTALRGAWRDFLARQPASHAVTLAYNPHRPGTASPCYRITGDGECQPLPGSGTIAQHGVNRLPVVRSIPLEQVHRDLDRLHGTIDRKLWGTRYNRLPSTERTSFVGFIEHAESNLHVHLAWYVPQARCGEFTGLITDAWEVMSPAATIWVEPVRDEGWAAYILKDQRGAALDGDPALFIASRAIRP